MTKNNNKTNKAVEDDFKGEDQDGTREARRGARHGGDGGDLPGEDGNTDEDGFGGGEGDTDEQLFVAMREPGERFTGMFIRHLAPGEAGMKYAGLLFAEYPSGSLKVVRPDWSIEEKIAEKEREDEDYFRKYLMRATLVNVVPKGKQTVKLYKYTWKAVPADFEPIYTEQFPEQK